MREALGLVSIISKQTRKERERGKREERREERMGKKKRKGGRKRVCSFILSETFICTVNNKDRKTVYPHSLPWVL
jgi:hypothetical protein